MDDLSKLEDSWRAMGFDSESLAKHVTEFQIAEMETGEFVGAFALTILGKQGQIHSEAYVDYALADAARPALWQRLQVLAQNHGLLRFWTLEKAPFYKHCGMVSPDEQALSQLPDAWKTEAGANARWLTLKLREDVEALMKADAEFALFMQAEREKSRRTIQRARVLKLVITLFAFAAFAVAAAIAFVLIRRNRALLGR
jgi:hypothetical protein